jgi:hypothetical protein
LGVEGFEHIAKTPEKQGVDDRGGAESGAVGAGSGAFRAARGDAMQDHMDQLLKLWPAVPAAVRDSILDLMKAMANRPKDGPSGGQPIDGHRPG